MNNITTAHVDTSPSLWSLLGLRWHYPKVLIHYPKSRAYSRISKRKLLFMDKRDLMAELLAKSIQWTKIGSVTNSNYQRIEDERSGSLHS